MVICNINHFLSLSFRIQAIEDAEKEHQKERDELARKYGEKSREVEAAEKRRAEELEQAEKRREEEKRKFEEQIKGEWRER